MGLPSVSVIVLNYNGLRYMQDCFTSLCALEYPADQVELVLADNGSSDGSVEYVQKNFANVRILAFDRNYGFCKGNNKAVAELNREYVAFLNSDMRVDSHWLLSLVQTLDAEPNVACVSSKILTWDGKAIDFGGTLFSFLGRASAEAYHEPNTSLYDTPRTILAPCGGAMLIRREVFKSVGGFDEDYGSYYEDVDLGWRLWILGYSVYFAPQSICYHVHFGTSSQKTSAQMTYILERNALYTILKNYEQCYLDRILPLALLLQFKHVYLLARASGIDMNQCRFDITEDVSAEQGPMQYELFWYEHAQITAISDVVNHFSDVMSKRKWIQEHRCRNDLDIFERTNSLTFAPWFDSPEYQEAHYLLMKGFDISVMFNELAELAMNKPLCRESLQKRVVEPFSRSHERSILLPDREIMTEAQRVAQDKDSYWSQIVRERDATIDKQAKEHIAFERILENYNHLLPLRLYFKIKRRFGKV